MIVLEAPLGLAYTMAEGLAGAKLNGGFGMVLDGSKASERKLKSMLFWDVNNGIARRNWARNNGAIFAIKRAMEEEPNLKFTIPNSVDDTLFNSF